MFQKFCWTLNPLLMVALFFPQPSFAGSTSGATSGGNVGSYGNTVFTVPPNIPSAGGFRTILGNIPNTIIVDVSVEGESNPGAQQTFSNFKTAYGYLVSLITNAQVNETITVKAGTATIIIVRQVEQASSGTATNSLTFERDDKKVGELTIQDDPELSDSASIVAAISFAAGMDLDQVNTASDMVLAGADPDSTAYLMLAVQKIQNSNQVDIQLVDFAINTFNDIVNKGNLETISALGDLPGFLSIRETLVAASPASP